MGRRYSRLAWTQASQRNQLNRIIELWAGHLFASSAFWLSLILLMCTFLPLLIQSKTEQNCAACRELVVLPPVISHQVSRTDSALSIPVVSPFLFYRDVFAAFFCFWNLPYRVDMKVATLWHLFKMPQEVKIPRLCTQVLNQSSLIFRGIELWITLRRGQLLWKLFFFDLRA